MRLLLLSDIHANVTALTAVLADIETLGGVDSCALLGDLINYGPRPNETIEIVKEFKWPLLVNLWGNHEYSIFDGDLGRFSTERGRSVLKYTNTILTVKSRQYLVDKMEHSSIEHCLYEGLSMLFMHGDLDDPYWGKFGIDKMNDERYAKYDFVISGHSHVPHYVERFFASDNSAYRNQKRTVFINPGSVGQPRNHNPFAQYGILDTSNGNFEHRSVWYDVESERRLFSDSVDVFYKDRLILGI